MNKPTLQEIEEAIRTLASAGMLLNAEQTIAVNRVRQEMEQLAEEENFTAEDQLRQQHEAQCRQVQENRQGKHERESAEKTIYETIQESPNQRISLNEIVPPGAIWNAMNGRLRTAFKKHMYANGMRGSLCTVRMAQLSKRLKEISRLHKELVQNCCTFADMHKILRSLIICWGQETSYGWSQKFFNDFFDFVQENFPQQTGPIPNPQTQKPTPNPQTQKVVKEPQQIQPTLFPDEVPQKKRRQVQLVDANWRKQTLDPFEALKVVVLRVGCEKVAKMGIQVGRTKLLRLSQPIGTKSYIQLNRYYWLQNRGTVYEIYVNILKIIEADNHVHFKDAKLISPNNA